MITLYVRKQGAYLRRVSQRLLVCYGEQVINTVRLRDLERVALFGQVEVTAPVMTALMEAGIEMVLLSRGGKFRGRLMPAEGKNIFLRQMQFRRYDDDEFRLGVSLRLIDAKIRNARFVLQKYGWNHPEVSLEATIALLDKRRDTLKKQTSIPSLLGVEGESARLYFRSFGAMVRSEFRFTTRSRRPPRDAMNALLSFGYTLMTTELTGAVAAQGLDPHVGVLHDLDYGRPSLALDLLEEFRQPVIDRLALSLVNRNVLRPEHFQDRGEKGVWMNDEGRVRFLELYHRTMDNEFVEKESGERVSYRTLLLRQARRMRGALTGEADYLPYLAK